MQNDFVNKHVVVTGGSGALGIAVVTELLGRGAHCHVPCIETAIPTHFSLATHDRVTATPGIELTSESKVRAYYEQLPECWASIHLAGGFAISRLLDTSQIDFTNMMNLNALTTFLCCREAIRRMNDQPGRIVNVAARPVITPVGGMIPYAASKAAVAAITQCLAQEVKSQRIWVNAVVPSIIDSAANRAAMPTANYDTWPKPAELAQAIAFLASASNASTTGTLVPTFGET
jgi:NAD(P)-dependent dehydrogenase (short-subunit alcohol dehydrogenase family)